VGPPPEVRPTSDRVREALFAILGDVRGLRVLDLYAGTGALGIEALSRGAESCTFVDRSVRSLAVLRRNLDALGLCGRSRVVRSEVLRRLRSWSRVAQPPTFDLVFLDPPYESAEIEEALAALVTGRLVSRGGEVVVESAKRHPWSAPAGLDLVDERRYGDTLVCLLVSGGARSSPSGPSTDADGEVREPDEREAEEPG